MGLLGQAIGIGLTVLITLGGTFLLNKYYPAATADTPAGTPGDSLLSRVNLELSALVVGLLVSIATLYYMTSGKK